MPVQNMHITRTRYEFFLFVIFRYFFSFMNNVVKLALISVLILLKKPTLKNEYMKMKMNTISKQTYEDAI